MMAGEYSRELSVKVFAGQSRLIQLGYRQGGPAGYGLRRQLVDQTGQPKAILDRGEYKSLQTDRVILTPGPESEQQVVQDIYQAFVREGRTEAEIATQLNRRGLLTDFQRPWSRGVVHQVLINEKYIGNNVWNRTSGKLKQPRTSNPVDQLVRADGAFSSVVDHALFLAAQAIIRARSRHWTDEQMLATLKQLFAERGCLSGLIIDEQEDCPSSSCYRQRFGSLLRSYSLIGYSPHGTTAFWRPIVGCESCIRTSWSTRRSAFVLSVDTSRSIPRPNWFGLMMSSRSRWCSAAVNAQSRRADVGSYASTSVCYLT